MSIQVAIKKGYYRGQQVSGVFTLVKPYKEGAKGGLITIKNPDPLPGSGPVQRITVEPEDFTLLDAGGAVLESHVVVESIAGKVITGANYEQVFTEAETEEEAMNRIEETFMMLDKITDAAAQGIIRGLVVSGPPGIGKSFGVEKQLNAANMFRVVEGKDPLYEIVSGGVSPIGLYQKLYYNRGANQVLVFDDTDQLLFDEECCSLIKAALNSGDRRRICWNKESRVLAVDDIPESFDFEGSILFLSNIDFDKSIAKGSRISAHLEAIMSRCHYLDLEIGSMRDKLLRIKQIIRDGMLTPYDFSPAQEKSIIDFVFDNADYMREVSLRAVKKLADFVKVDANDWYEMAEATLLTKEAKFRRLVEKQKAKVAEELLLVA